MQTQLPIKRALISVSDKTGVVEFANKLSQLNIEILATGGTAQLLQQNNIAVIDIAQYTGFPEMMDGRVKTLHPKIYGGLLGRRGIDDKIMQQHSINPIDLLIVNLYPFAATIQKENCMFEDAVEQIDIGGPSMLRAAAKNFKAVTVVVDPTDYSRVLEEMQKHQQATSEHLRLSLAQKVFIHTAQYDQTIADYLRQQNNPAEKEFPTFFQPQFKLREILRYGENPHQKAAFYQTQKNYPGSLAEAKLLQGKSLSYNNMLDADCALQTVQALSNIQAACVIVKHATPCGVAQSDKIEEAYQKAFKCDPESAFGGIIAFNQPISAELAQQLSQQFAEVILAPAVNADALQIFNNKPQLRVLAFGKSAQNKQPYNLRSISGGLLVQDHDDISINETDIQVVTERAPTKQELQDLLFAWEIVKFTKSNAIVYAKNLATLGIGCGQTSRVFAVKIAAQRAEAAKLSLNSAVMASDAFFPFADSIELAASFGIQAVIQPGGSKRDHEVIAAANQANIAMVFTGTRHFRH